MAVSIRNLIIILVLVLQFFFMAATMYSPLHGPFDNAFRHTERVKAYLDWKQNPSSSSKASYDQEMRLLHSHLGTRNLVIIIVLGLEAVGVYYVWDRKTKVAG